MLRLLNKEFKLFLVKPTMLFFVLAAMMLIPAYPAIVSTFFVFFIIQICFQVSQTNRDIEFTAMLPVSRKQIVQSKILFTMSIQLIHLAICIPFAIISSLVLTPEGNSVGMDKNIAFFGYALVATAVFNILFFSQYFKNTHKLGVPIVLGLVGYTVFCLAFEVIVAVVPSIKATLDTLSASKILPQILFLVVSVVVYLAMMWGTYKLSEKAFVKMVI